MVDTSTLYTIYFYQYLLPVPVQPSLQESQTTVILNELLYSKYETVVPPGIYQYYKYPLVA